MPLADILSDTVTPIRTNATGVWIEGERDEVEVPGTPFLAFFDPPSDQESNRKGRRVAEPTIIYIEGALRAEDVVTLAAPRLGGFWDGRWQVNGDPQPFGPPYDTPVGYQARLRRVDD